MHRRPQGWWTAVRLDDTRVVFFGAASGHPPESVSILDISTATLTLAGRTRLPRGNSTAHLLPDGSVLLVGGSMPAPFRHIFQEPEIWQPTKGLGVRTTRPRRTTRPPGQHRREGHLALT